MLGRYLIESVQGTGDKIRFVTAVTRNPAASTLFSRTNKIYQRRWCAHLKIARLSRCRRLDLVWSELYGHVLAVWQLRRSDPQGRKTGRPAGRAADQVPARDQPQDRQRARLRHSSQAAFRG